MAHSADRGVAPLTGRRILILVTGGIAAYKIPTLIRLLKQDGADVRVVTTAAARQFVTVKTLETLSGHPTYSFLFEPTDEFPVLHLGLAEWADVNVIAPATANVIAKIAHGLADDLVSTLMLATRAHTVVVPAMEEGMLDNPRVKANIDRLQGPGLDWVDTEEGELASGKFGRGRMAEPERIASRVSSFLISLEGESGSGQDLRGRHVVVTAGPTFEDIDPVRFIGNQSSGRMGFAIACRARERGAVVQLVTGPTALQDPAGMKVVHVRSTAQMLIATQAAFDDADALIMAAAVADFRPQQVSVEKMHRSESCSVTLELVANPDILQTLGASKGSRVTIGFALETESDVAAARAKLRRKHADMIALNSLSDEGAGFGVETNVVTFVTEDSESEKLPLMSKDEVADRLLDRTRELLTTPGRGRPGSEGC
jgi:phosphopantothenoylcysteine decarboxylase/phosphopantothenate--cysteine ligase